jgi:RimJ/RimL family protein N-acetyltransferase
LKRRIKELKPDDIDLIINYFRKAGHHFLKAMGVDPKKLPPKDEWHRLLIEDFNRSIPYKQFYYLIWEVNGYPVGHSNINKIVFGSEAYMHMHMWDALKRQRGYGAYFIRRCISLYFETFNLQRIICEPYALNPGPNKTLGKVGFELEKNYDTTPGWINFHQSANRWVLTKDKWFQLKHPDNS